MIKRILIISAIGFISSLSGIFSQEANGFGLHAEFGLWGEFTKRGDKWGGQQLFLTPVYAIGDNTNVGIGVGLRWYSNSYSDESIISYPLYVSALYKFNAKKVVPFVEGKMGYNYLKKNYYVTESLAPGAEHVYSPTSVFLPTDELLAETRGGFFLSPSAGALFPVKDKSISLSVAYSFDRESYKYRDTPKDNFVKNKGYVHSVALRVGYIF